VPPAQVAVELGDMLLAEGPYSGTHLATASFTPVVEEASRTLRRRLIERAAADPLSPLFGAPVAQLTIDDGLVRSLANNRSEKLADLLARASRRLEATASAQPDERPHYSPAASARCSPKCALIPTWATLCDAAYGRLRGGTRAEPDAG
jgi:hypothetical protein